MKVVSWKIVGQFFFCEDSGFNIDGPFLDFFIVRKIFFRWTELILVSIFKCSTFFFSFFICLELPSIYTLTQFYRKLKFFFYKFIGLKKLFYIDFGVDIEYLPTDVEGTLYKFLISEGLDIGNQIKDEFIEGRAVLCKEKVYDSEIKFDGLIFNLFLIDGTFAPFDPRHDAHIFVQVL